MMLAADELNRLTAPVTQAMLDAGVDELKAGFVALRCVLSVLEGVRELSPKIDFILKHQSFPASGYQTE